MILVFSIGKLKSSTPAIGAKAKPMVLDMVEDNRMTIDIATVPKSISTTDRGI
jgi:S-adenosylmethionine synthetase